MVPLILALPGFVAVNCGTLPVPVPVNPIAGLELVQVKVTGGLAGDVMNNVAGIIDPSFTVVSVRTVTDGTGFTCTVNVTEFAHWPDDGVNV